MCVLLRASAAPLSPAGSAFVLLTELAFYPEWQQARAELLPAAYEAALRAAAHLRLQLQRPDAEHLPGLMEVAALSCRDGTAYCHSWLQVQQARLSAADVEQLLARFVSLASTVLKLAVVGHASQEQRRQSGSGQNALGSENTCLAYLKLLDLCQTLAACAFEVAQDPTDRCGRWATFCLLVCVRLAACLPAYPPACLLLPTPLAKGT